MFWSALRRRKDSLFERVVPDSPARPEPTSISPAAGNTGITVTISGTGFQNPPGMYVVTSVTFNDVPATNVVVVDDETLTCTVPTSGAGRKVVRIFGPGGDRAVPGGYVVGFDPAVLNLTGWWRDYPGAAPWTGTASAGTSAANSQSHAFIDPSGGTLNGHGTAVCDGATTFLEDTSNNFDAYVSGMSGSIAMLLNAASAAADLPPTPYLNPGLIAQFGGGTTFGVTFSDAGLVVAYYDGLGWERLAVACSTNAWHLAQVRWSPAGGGSVLLEARVDGGAWVSATMAAAWTPSAGPPVLASNESAGAIFDGTIADTLVSPLTLADGDFDNLRLYCNTRYGVSL